MELSARIAAWAALFLALVVAERLLRLEKPRDPPARPSNQPARPSNQPARPSNQPARPSNQPARPPPWRRVSARLDLAYWWLTPIFTRRVSEALVGIFVVIPLWAAGDAAGLDLRAGFGPAADWPPWAQLLGSLVVMDAFSYGWHRLSHATGLWYVHAIHHAPEEVDWLSSERLHPLSDALAQIAVSAPVLCLGFPPAAVGAWVIGLRMYMVFLHAPLPWDYGPLRFVVASPRFHRWHHARAPGGCNFAGLFPIWDLLGGTLYLPRREPAGFGIDEDLPEGLLAQWLWPFERWFAPERADPVRGEAARGAGARGAG